MNRSRGKAFLKDALVCSLGAYGGPEAHIGVFMDQLVNKKHYVTEEELIELVALCTVLPGPTSTQTLVAIGHKIGGPWLAFLTMLVWSLPVLTFMTLLSFVYQLFEALDLSVNTFKYVGPMAVGFIVVAAIKINQKVVTDGLTVGLMLLAAAVTYWIHSPWVFPVLLLVGGLASIAATREKALWHKVKVDPPWIYFILFAFLAVGGAAANYFLDNKLVTLFESFYRYGYLVFGGGQVVVPVMYNELVDIRHYLSHEEFLLGYGLVQGLPGPMFSFSAYAGGMAYRDSGIFLQTISALIGGIGIFLPGLLLIYFVYPVWESLKQIQAIKVSLRGVNAIAGGFIAVSAVVLLQKSGLTVENLVVVGLTMLLLQIKKLPVPFIVLIALMSGLLFT